MLPRSNSDFNSRSMPMERRSGNHNTGVFSFLQHKYSMNQDSSKHHGKALRQGVYLVSINDWNKMLAS